MPADDWKEVIPNDEAPRLEHHAAYLAQLQQRAISNGRPLRALHAKANLAVEATFEVLADIPDYARHGLFATPTTYRAVARFSNGAGRYQPDRKPDVRGLAVKLFDVPGTKIIAGMEDARTQDFLAIRASRLPISNAEEFMLIVRASQAPALLPLRIVGGLGLRRGIAVLRRAISDLKQPQSPLAATTFYSALPIQYGRYAVQFAFAAQDSPEVIKRGGPNQLGDALAERLRSRPVIYDFRVRFFVDEATTPIEDAAVEWNAQWVTVARLTLPVQDPHSPRGKRVSELVEHLAFDPWHARADLRPLGNIMRARNVAYRVSSQGRDAAPEPSCAPTFGDD